MRPKAIVVTLGRDTGELEALVGSLGHDVVGVIAQKRDRPDPATYVGRGKLDEVRDAKEESGASLVVFDAQLKAGQIATLERELGGDVWDRIRLILEIFTQRAGTREARLQVELARLRYEVPLVREYVHRAKTGEHPGFMAGGEYSVDQYLNQIRSRMSRVQKELRKVEGERAGRRKHRRRGGFRLVSLAGYTNAGKSSLLSALTGREVVVEDRLFSTLETRTAALSTVRGSRILVTDTVGFISDLPPFLIDAFRATLEEIEDADLVLLLVDVSDAEDVLMRKMEASIGVLAEFVRRPPVVLVGSKVDLVPKRERAEKLEFLRELGDRFGLGNRVFLVSTATHEGLKDLASDILGK